MTMPPNTLFHTFSLYNAIVILDDDGTRLHWNSTLGFSIDRESLNWPIVDISDMPDILAGAKEARDNLQSSFGIGLTAGWINCLIDTYGYCDQHGKEIFNPPITERITNPHPKGTPVASAWDRGCHYGWGDCDASL